MASAALLRVRDAGTIALRKSSVVRSRFARSRGNCGIMKVLPEVAEAISAGMPVVALETTIVTHGMPYPTNLHTAQAVEAVVRAHGSVPATIGVLDGYVHVGMTEADLSRLAEPNLKGRKISRRDLSYVISKVESGGTTVSATMLCAHKAGIPVFATGGIGGVHRGGESSMDVSADLTELGRTPLAVVCAGAKSILDIGRTLEVLETLGVTVTTFGHTTEFPAFFSARSGHHVDMCVRTPKEAAKLIASNLSFGVGSGTLIAVPIPEEASGLGEEIEGAIQRALTEAQRDGVMGKALTPFLLRRINELTCGRSLEANIHLIKNNAMVGSQIAVELSKLKLQGYPKMSTSSSAPPTCIDSAPSSSVLKAPPPSVHQAPPTIGGLREKQRGGSHSKQPVVVGGCVVDYAARLFNRDIIREGTNPGRLIHSFGGVGRNIAECLARLKTPPFFISAVGRDHIGQILHLNLKELGVELTGVLQSPDLPTASYCAILDCTGEMTYAIGDMDIHDLIDVSWLKRFTEQLTSASIVVVDSNIPQEAVKFVCDTCWLAGVPVLFEPTTLEKAAKPFMVDCHSKVTYMSPNLAELRAMHSALTGRPATTTSTLELSVEAKLEESKALCSVLSNHVPDIFVKLGKDGVLYASRRQGGVHFLHYPPASPHLLPVSVVNVTGCGDSFVGAMVSSLVRGFHPNMAVKAGLRAAHLSLLCKDPISHDVAPSLFTESSLSEWAPWNATSM